VWNTIAYTNSHSYCQGHCHCDSYCYIHSDSHCYSDSDSNVHAHPVADAYSNGNVHAHPIANTYSDGHCHGCCYSYRDSNVHAHPIANAYSDGHSYSYHNSDSHRDTDLRAAFGSKRTNRKQYYFQQLYRALEQRGGRDRVSVGRSHRFIFHKLRFRLSEFGRRKRDQLRCDRVKSEHGLLLPGASLQCVCYKR
jgi:hypothetical protein